jgi:hypothetical protein
MKPIHILFKNTLHTEYQKNTAKNQGETFAQDAKGFINLVVDGPWCGGCQAGYFLIAFVIKKLHPDDFQLLFGERANGGSDLLPHFFFRLGLNQ